MALSEVYCNVQYTSAFWIAIHHAQDDPLAAADKPAYLGRAAAAKFAFSFW
jgi:hypothetical protein